MTYDAQIYEGLLKVRSLIENPLDWCKGTVLNASGQRCLEGAISATSYSTPKIYEGVRVYLRAALPEHWRQHPLCCYNDNCTTTHQDILDLIDRALEIARPCKPLTVPAEWVLDEDKSEAVLVREAELVAT